MITSYEPQKRVTRKKVYVSGPLFSSGKPADNVQRAIELARDLIEIGYAPLVPHLTWHIDPEQRIKHAVWMEVDLPWVSMADAVIRIDGPSSGADQECREAFSRGIPVCKTVAQLMKECPP